ncbi:TetR/AcrR family transcriptional regulator [Paenibacillus eucommiae]|uniref:AcrR family transcriptional regulator n=1 Tax=Paenibacillus eucommiae TaxID=1355755 RepID=A0ABS4J4Z3_9BACL|nr:TetR family transcriptional regulator C-terminal domain-containing protein [Paenibacillus eucommiae]MBP1994910.1 AcrR family transcriptional regulator [Paenibacillus eucommiae]
MPKIVDHNQRREQIAEAVWRIIRRDGLEAVSVRSVANEAGISLGSLRHYFDTQSELLAFSMRLMSERVNYRIKNLPFSGDPRHDIGLVISELLPLNGETLAESEVWLAFMGKTITDETLRTLGREVHDELYAGFRSVIDLLIQKKMTKEGIDAEYEAKRLHALVDGLVVHHVNFPERVPKDDLMRIVLAHLDSFIIE